MWFVQQYVSYLQNGDLLDDPGQIAVQPNIPPSRTNKILQLREKCVSSVSDTEILLLLHRLFSKLVAVSSGSEQAIDYLFEVILSSRRLPASTFRSLYPVKIGLLTLFSGTGIFISGLFQVSEKVPELYELLEDIVELGGWVEPDVPWPKLVYLQVKPLFLTDVTTCSNFIQRHFNKSHFHRAPKMTL